MTIGFYSLPLFSYTTILIISHNIIKLIRIIHIITPNNLSGKSILRLTQVQANAWCLSLQEDVRNAEKQYNIEVSDDYSTITIYGYKETVYRDVVKAQELEAKNVLIRSFKRQDYLCNLIMKD